MNCPVCEDRSELISDFQFAHKFLDRHAMMSRNVLEHAVQQTRFQRTMIGNADVMLATAFRRQLNMRTGLPRGS
jgi:hypothetical protein